MAQEPGWWTLAPILPGTDPVAGLVRHLAAAAQRLGLGWSVAQVRHQLDDGGLTGLTDELLLTARAQRLLVVVDQFEELLTQAPSGQRARFAQLLHPVLGGPVQVVATLRPEFLDQLLLDPDLAVLPTRHYPLRPLRREALRSVIQGPAQLAGIEVDDELMTRLIADTDSGEALPLLAFTLAQLAEGIGHGGQLSDTRYDELGGVQGALTLQADAALADATTAVGRSREEVIAGLLRLVTVDEQGHPTRWRVNRAQLPDPVTRELDAFVGRRLLTTDTDNSSVVIGVAHEAFLSAWTPLAQAIEDNVSALRARRAVEQAATEWDAHSRPWTRLWERGQLAAAVADTGTHLQARNLVLVIDRVELSPTACAFLRISILRDLLRRGLAITVLAALLIVAMITSGFAFTQKGAAEQQRDAAVSRQVAGQATELRATNPALAAQLSLAAYRLASTVEARGSLLSTFAIPYATRLTGHTKGIGPVAFSADGHTLATGSVDHTARLWDISDPRNSHQLGALTGHTDTVFWVAFSPDGHTLATASADHTARLWDISDPRNPHQLGILTGHTGNVNAAVFSPDGHTLATAGFDGTARLWDVGDPRNSHPLGTLTGHTTDVHSVAFSPDGHTLATASADHTARLWDISDPRNPHLLGILTGHTDTVYTAVFSPDGRTLATSSADQTARLWDITDPHNPSLSGILTGHTNLVFVAVFSPDGHTLATSSADNTARLWDIPGPVTASHTKTVSSVAFSVDGRTLATASHDGTARLWDITDPHNLSVLSSLTGHTSGLSSVAFSPDRRTLATGSYDGTARLWDITDLRRPSILSTLRGHDHGVYSVAFSPDGHTLATASFDNTARLWDLRDLRQPHLLDILTGHAEGVYSVAFSPDGHTLATASRDSTARLWDVSNPRNHRLLGIITAHASEVHSVAFSPDGHTLARAVRKVVSAGHDAF